MKRPILAISDPQFHSYKAHSKVVGGANSRLVEIQTAWERAIEIGKRFDCGLIAVPGDVFEVRGALKPSVFNHVTQDIAATLEAGFDMVAIPGNHDMEHYVAGDSAIDTWSLLRGNPSKGSRCEIITKPGVVEIAGYKVLGIPYINDTARFKDVFRQLNQEGDPDVILIHQGIDDFDPTGSITTGLSVKWLEEESKALILAGHYHNVMRSGRVINVGALVQHRASDEGQRRGCWVIEDVEHPGDAVFHPIDGPRFLTVTGKNGINGGCKDAFVVVKAKSIKDGEKLKKLAEDAGAASVTVQVEKVFVPAHTQTIQISTPHKMLGDYLDIAPHMTPHKGDIMNLFQKVCIGAQV